MKYIRCILMIAGCAGVLGAQNDQSDAAALVQGLQSRNVDERIQAFYRHLGPQNEKLKAVRTPEIDALLVRTLLRENSLIREALIEGTGASIKYGEGYSEYAAWLASAVMSIAEDNPETPLIWDALLQSPFHPDSAFARWLSERADRVIDSLLRQAKGIDPYRRRGDAIEILGEILHTERIPGRRHHLKDSELAAAEEAIRAGLEDRENLVQWSAWRALSRMGNASDLALLERIAVLDPDFRTDGGRSGRELRYPSREAARTAAQALRRRLEAEKQQ